MDRNGWLLRILRKNSESSAILTVRNQLQSFVEPSPPHACSVLQASLHLTAIARAWEWFLPKQAMGVPVVSSNHGGIPEVVRDGETGFLAPERDYEGLADRIAELLGDDDLWLRFSSRAITWVPERFDVRRQTMRLESLYETVIRGRPVSQ